MNINATLIGQMITFAVFVWFTMKFVWPPLMRMMEERRTKIADGLAAAEQGRNELELARHKVKQQLSEAKTEAAHIIEKAHQRAHHIVEEAKANARVEGDRLLQLAKGEIEQQTMSARAQLVQEISGIAIAGAERILQKEIDQKGHDHLVQSLVGEIE